MYQVSQTTHSVTDHTQCDRRLGLADRDTADCHLCRLTQRDVSLDDSLNAADSDASDAMRY